MDKQTIFNLPKSQVDELIQKATTEPLPDQMVEELKQTIKENNLSKEQAKELIYKVRTKNFRLLMLEAQMEATPERKVALAKLYRREMDKPLI